MTHVFRIAAAVSLLTGLSSCATLMAVPVHPGLTEAEVVARLGRPTHVYPDGSSRLLEYMHGPMGETTDMARIGPDGKLVSYKQVLTLRQFATIKVGQADKETVLRTVGAPSFKRYYSLSGLEAWSYPFKEHDLWYMEMSVYFDKAGIVRKLENGLDPRYVYGANGCNGHK